VMHDGCTSNRHALQFSSEICWWGTHNNYGS
jgi:hypothetical protein